MKLRIRGNSLRFRLGRSEVESFALTGLIEERVQFGMRPGNDLCYTLQKTAGYEFTGTFTDGKISVGVPEMLANRWASSAEVSIEGSQKLDDRTDLKFLIEKDFVCLNAHNDEDQSDRYPHPKGEDPC
jgi:hypothetical protein